MDKYFVRRKELLTKEKYITKKKKVLLNVCIVVVSMYNIFYLCFLAGLIINEKYFTFRNTSINNYIKKKNSEKDLDRFEGNIYIIHN